MARELLERGATMAVMAMNSEELAGIDQRVVMRVDWETYEALDRARGERSHPRITYLDGVAELMSPSTNHEQLSEWINTLVQIFCAELRIVYQPLGSWTLKDRDRDAGAEPDKCFIFGSAMRERPDLAIEVVWTSGGLEKLDVYRRLGVREVWYWIDDELTVYLLEPHGYEPSKRSECLPALDLSFLITLLESPTIIDAITRMREYAANLRP